jgi:hypothetical protein
MTQGEFTGAKRVNKKRKVSTFWGLLQDMTKWETEYLQFKLNYCGVKKQVDTMHSQCTCMNTLQSAE